jgi:hypothetical protein
MTDQEAKVKRMIRQASERFAEAAQGTCMSEQEVLCHIDLEEFQADDLDWCIIEDIVFLCNDCGWWCEVGDWATQENICEENICSDCGGNYDDDGEPI